MSSSTKATFIDTQMNPIFTKHSSILIIGAGIAGLTTAILFRQKGFKNVHLYERDDCFSRRRQGYGLTILQGRQVLRNIGVLEQVKCLNAGSKTHYIFDQDGQILGFFGAEFWLKDYRRAKPLKTSMHVPRQQLRRVLYEKYLSLGRQDVCWDHKLTHVSSINCTFGSGYSTPADLIVACDGFNSCLRPFAVYPEDDVQLNYLGAITVLGITHSDHFLSNERVFQTVNGQVRLFAMPFSLTDPTQKIMWQLSFPLEESESKKLSSSNEMLKEYVYTLCKHWHQPIPSLIRNTKTQLLMGIPTYDRDPILPHSLQLNHIALLGDAAHPMSPFKGQGANQALLDANLLSDLMIEGCSIPETIIKFHAAMMERVRSKVLLSRERAKKYHSLSYVNIDNFLYPRIDRELIDELKRENITAKSGENIEKAIKSVMDKLKVG